MTSQEEQELRQAIQNAIGFTGAKDLQNCEITIADIDEVMTLFKAQAAQIEKAYGGCHNCYGKGYATVNDRWIGHDTDQDIGSRGGVIAGGNANAMKFCTCERGEQLKEQIAQIDVAARIDELKGVLGTSGFPRQKHLGMLDTRLEHLHNQKKEAV